MEFNYKEVLNNSFRERKSRNPGYSLRAYARDLEVSLTALSEVLAGKRNFSEKNAKKVSEKLCLTPSEYKAMLFEIKKKTLESDVQQEVLQLKEDEFNLISKWYFLAILTLSSQKKVKASPRSLAKRFGISTDEVKEAIEALGRLGLINVTQAILKRTSRPIRTTSDVPSYAIRGYHKQNLDVIKHSLDHTPIDLREVSSMNLNIDPKKIDKAKKLINDFKEDFTKEMEKGSPKEVYTLAIHFFPATLREGDHD